MEKVKVEVVENNPEEKERSGRVKNAYAAWVATPYGSIDMSHDGSLLLPGASDNIPDKMGIPSGFHDRVQLARYYYEVDPVASTAIDKIIDIGISQLVFDRGDCSDEEYAVYKAPIELFTGYLRESTLEYLISGLVVPECSWKKFTPAELDMDTSRQYELPDKCWLLNPDQLELKFVPFSTDVEVWLKVPDEVRRFIAKNGKREDGSRDTETYDRLVKQFPKFVAAVRRGDSKILLEDAYNIRRRPKTYDPYPTPYLLSALESMAFKRNLKKMDYSIASRVIGAIQVIRLGNDDYPLTEDDEDQLDELKNQMLWRNRENNIDRVFQLFANHTLDIEWVYPSSEAMLSQGKYEAVNTDIYNALGMPRILVSGETLRSATSQAKYAMFSPAETMKRVREDILEYVKELISEIRERNKFENEVEISFEELRLYDLGELAEIGVALYQNNAISLTTLAGMIGFNFEEELYKKSNERDLMKEHGVPEFPPLPFSPKPGVPGTPDTGGPDEPDTGGGGE